MTLIDSLVKFFPQLKKLNLSPHDILNRLHIHIGSNNKSIQNDYHIEKVIVLNINANKTSDKDLIPIVQSAFNQDLTLLQGDKIGKLEDLGKAFEKNKDLVSILKPILPAEDIFILRCCIPIKEMFEQKKDISVQKMNILQRFGKKGNNILNCLTAGYFESEIIPFYKELDSSVGFNRLEFLEFYEKIVHSQISIIFVRTDLSRDKLIEEIIHRLNYHLARLDIHGINRQNIEKIEDAISILEKKQLSKTYKIQVERDSRSIYVRLDRMQFLLSK